MLAVPEKKDFEFTIGTINVQTLSNDVKLGTTFELVRSLRHDVLCMQETRRIGEGIIEDNGIKFIWKGHKRKKISGVGILITSRVTLEDVFYISERLIQIHVIVGGIRLCVTNCYAPPDYSKESQKDQFYRDFQKAINAIPKSYKSIIGGDLNATIGEDSSGYWSCLGPTNNVNMKTNDNGKRLLAFAEQNNHRLENSIRPSKQRLINTWLSPNGFEKRIDYILTSKFLQRYVTKCRVRRGSSLLFDTDHWLLEVALYLPSKKKLKIDKRPLKKKEVYNVDDLKPNKSEYCNHLDNLLEMEPPSDIEQINQTVVDSTLTAVHQTCSINKTTSKEKPWEDEELHDLLKSQWKAKNHSEIRNVRKKIKLRRQQLLNEFYGKRAEAINSATEAHNVSREYAESKKYKMHQKSSSTTIPKQKLHDHFSAHFNVGDIEMPIELQQPENSCLKDCLNQATDVNETPPDTEEVLTNMEKLKSGKCSGIDDIKMESLKYGTGSTRLVLFIVTLLQLIWTCLVVPSIWTQAIISCIFKNKGAHSDASNHRAISITATLGRLLPMIIINRLQAIYNIILDQNQYGFRSNSGCDDAIFIVKNVMERSGEKMYIAFVDLTAAYDKIPRHLLFRVLDIRLGCIHLVSLVKSIYIGTTAKIKGLSKSFIVNSGCRQGGIESPFIFNIFLDTVCRILDSELTRALGDSYGIKYDYRIPNEASNRKQRSECPLHGWERIKRVLYADDMCIIFRNKEALQKGLEIMESVFCRYGLILSRKKTETMVVNGDDDETWSPSLVTLGHYKIKNTTEFKYLGILLSVVNPSSSTQHRIAATIGKFAELQSMLQDQRICLRTRGSFMNSFIRSRLAYNVHTWFKATKYIEKLNVEWVRMLRRIVKGGFKRRNAPPPGLTEDDRKNGSWDYAFIYSNAKIHSLTSTKPLQIYVEQQQLYWLAHCIRMPNSCKQKQTLFMRPTKPYFRDIWLDIEKSTGIDRKQLQRTMIDEKHFNSWMRDRYRD